MRVRRDKEETWMRSALFYLPVWVFALGALWMGTTHAGALSSVHVGLGGLGVTVANALMIQHRRISDLERELRALKAGREADGEA